MFESIRSDEENVLILDSGGVFPTKGFKMKLKAEVSLKAMNYMGYAAMNLGGSEFYQGTDFLEKATSDIGFPLITSNLVYEDSRLPFGETYVIKDVGGVRVGILGVMPSNAFEKIANPRYVENLKIIPPETALKNLLPEVKEKADFIILLSQCGFETTTLLVNNVHGIGLAISSQSQGSKLPCKNVKTPVMRVALRGESLGFIKLTIDDTGQIIRSQGKMIKLNESVAADVQITKMIDVAHLEKAREKKRIRAVRQRRELEQKAKELLKLTPQEYIEILHKKQSEAGGKR